MSSTFSTTSLAFLLMSLVLVGAQAICPPHPPYTQSVLSLSWPGEFCHQSRCTQGYDEDWDGHTFRIHGYWPQYDSEDRKCLTRGKRPDPYCRDSYPFNEHELLDIKNDLDIYWPQWGNHNNQTFRKNQYKKHGVCYIKLNHQQYGVAKDILFQTYFSSSIEKARSINRVTKFYFNNKDELARQLGIASNEYFYTTCNKTKKDRYIIDLRICYDLGEPENQSQVDCYKRDLDRESSSCPYPLKLREKQ